MRGGGGFEPAFFGAAGGVVGVAGSFGGVLAARTGAGAACGAGAGTSCTGMWERKYPLRG